MGQYYIYFMTNWTGEVLYIGVTNNLERRLYEHKHKIFEGFSQSYNLNKLVYFEAYDAPTEAIAREKQLKKWARAKKNKLVEALNPNWQDLSADWYG